MLHTLVKILSFNYYKFITKITVFYFHIDIGTTSTSSKQL